MDTCTSYLRPCSLFSTRCGSAFYSRTLQIGSQPGLLLPTGRTKKSAVTCKEARPRSFFSGSKRWPRPVVTLEHHDRLPSCQPRCPRSYYCNHYRVTQKVLYADPLPSPVPDSGNLRPVHFRTLRLSLLHIVPVTAGRDLTSPSEHTVPPSLLRLHLQSQKLPPGQTRSLYRHDTSQVIALTPRGRIIIVIRRAQRHPKTS